ncbi:hypothetical protein [Nonomuraea sp. NPDC001699]
MSADVMWKDFSPGPHGTPSPDLARRLASDPVGTVVLPSGDIVPMAVRYDDVRAVLSCPHSSRTGLAEPGRPCPTWSPTTPHRCRPASAAR